MEHTWGTPETQPPERDPSGLRAEHFYLLLAVMSVSAAIVLYVADSELAGYEVNRGAYAILVSFFVAGYCGWLSRSAQRRLRVGQTKVCDRLEQIAAELAGLRDAVEQLRAAHPPTVPRQRNVGRVCMSTAVGGEGDTVPLAPAVAPDTIAVLRRINMKLIGNEDLH